MTESMRFRCSPWAQQGSNLRPLGEQPAYDESRSNHSDLVEHRSAYDQRCADTTTLVDAKWTADHGPRVPVPSRRERVIDAAAVGILFLPRTISFGYGHNEYPPADITVDVRYWFRDPHIDPALRYMTGRDAPVIDKVLGTPGVEAFSAALFGAIVALAASQPDRPVNVAVGCVGGRHRSYVIAEYLAGMARSSGWDADTRHLHVDRPVIERGR